MERIKTIAILIALTIATLAVYWQVQHNDFINYDDPLYVTDNPKVRDGLSLRGVRWAFVSTEVANWHPLTWLSHMLDVELFGKNPSGHHLTNLFFHIANTLLLFLILKEMTTAYWRSAFVAAMFAIHPLHVESVAWIAERKDVLSAFFWFLTLASYVSYHKSSSRQMYFAALCCYVLAILSKPMVVTLPFVLLLLDFWPLKRVQLVDTKMHGIWESWRPLLIEKAPFFILSLASCIVTYYAQVNGGAVGSLKIIPMSVRISNAFISYVEYLRLTFWPHDLAVFYPYADTIFLSKALGAALIILFISIFAFISAIRIPYIFVGWFWYLGTLVPVIGLVQVGAQSLADRYTYLPLIGISLIFSWGAAEIAENVSRKRLILSICIMLLLTSWTFTSWHQVSYWKNSFSLLEHAISVTRDNTVAHNNLGQALAKAGKSEEAFEHYKAALRISPFDAGALNNLAVQLMHNGKTVEAAEYLRRAVQANPHSEIAHINLGIQLVNEGSGDNISEAMHYFSEALRINPLSFRAHYHMGLALMASNKQAAINHFDEAIRHNPGFGFAHYQLSVIYSQQKIFEKAEYHYLEALKSDDDPKLDSLHRDLADQLQKQGKIDDALSQMRTALRINPDSSLNNRRLADILLIKGRTGEARHYYQEALRIDPADLQAREDMKKLGINSSK